MGTPRPVDETASRQADGLVLADREVVRKAEDILTCMANAVSAMKLFPSDHATVRNFVDILSAKFDDFFMTYARLEVGIGEYAFTCGGKVVYTDETTLKSLPFFFFKDGAQILYFYRGLDRSELVEFLELIKNVAQKPGGDNDIVAALWESDFSNIQYYSPDEFIENQILDQKREVQAGQGPQDSAAEKQEGQADLDLPELPSDLSHEALELKVDLARLSHGRIELKQEDMAKFHWQPGAEGGQALPAPSGRGPGPEPSGGPEASSGLTATPVATINSNLTEAEVRELDEMVQSNRALWPEEEFVKMTAEVVYLEADLAGCAASIDILVEFYLEQIGQGQFPAAGMIISKVRDLKSHTETESAGKSALLESCLKKMLGPKSLEAVAAHLAASNAVDWKALFGFFKLLGPSALPIVASFFDTQRDQAVQEQALAFIREAGRDNPGLIARLANDSRPILSREVIRILMGLPGQKGISHLSAFLMFKNRDLKLELIHALGDLRDEMSNKILMGFLNDPDEELRIQAAMKLNPTEEKARIVHVVNEASGPAFRNKSLKEKQAILSFLGRTRSAEALAFLTAVLGRTTFFPSAKNTEMRLAAVAGLKNMATPEATAALESGTQGKGRKVRDACAEALARLASGPGGQA
jgi:HEAT repeat protein